MNTRQIRYAVLLSQTRNFSRLAQKLNIAQSALSKQILSLEQELGVKLFDRSTTPLSLTPAGEAFVRDAHTLLYKEDQLIRSMEQYRTGSAGQLTIGITPFRSSYLISNMVKETRKAFPGIKICLQESGSDALRKEAAEGKFDFAIVNLPVDDSIFHVRFLPSDSLTLVMTKELSHLIPMSVEPGNPMDFALCGNIPFIVPGASQEMRQLFDRMCVTANFVPNIAVEVVNLTTAWTLARSGIGATLLPMEFVSRQAPDPSLLFLPVLQAPSTRQPVIITRQDQYLSPATKFAIGQLCSL